MQINREAVVYLCKLLRSGRFVKHSGSLSGGENKRCVLGMVCETYMEMTGKGSWEYSKIKVNMCFLDHVSSLPQEVMVFFGFTSTNPKLNIKELSYIVSACNDVLGLSFEELADAFENTFLN